MSESAPTTILTPLRKWLASLADDTLTPEQRDEALRRYLDEEENAQRRYVDAKRQRAEVQAQRDARIDNLEALVDARLEARLRELGLTPTGIDGGLGKSLARIEELLAIRHQRDVATYLAPLYTLLDERLRELGLIPAIVEEAIDAAVD